MELTENVLQELLAKLRIEELNEMQRAAISALNNGDELVLLSPTGTGKTLGYLLPALQYLRQDLDGVQALVLAPSRELAIQIERVFRKMQTGFKVNVCYGGNPIRIEKKNLKDPPALLIGTPGRIADHLRKGSFDPLDIHTLILDEFDKSLEFGFQGEMEFILGEMGLLHKKILTSATRAEEIPAFTGVVAPQILDFLGDEEPDKLTLKAVKSADEEEDKMSVLYNLLCEIGDELTLVFCNHRNAVDRASKLLGGRGIIHAAFHGGLDQQERERVLIKFRNGSLKLLVTTDLAARGLDIPDIKNVVHYQIPYDEKAFIHRNGRTARMQATGIAYFVMAAKDYFPPYIKNKPEIEIIEATEKLPQKPKWVTLFIHGGKKDKINKIDIVGLFCKKGKLAMEELGLIEVKDYYSYIAVRRNSAKNAIKKLNGEKIKKRKVRIEMAL